MADIVKVILADHARIRALFAELGDSTGTWADIDCRPMLHHVWATLDGLLELHSHAEEEICYLALSRYERGAARDIQEAIADLDDIREAMREARLLAVGCPAWWRAVRAARTAAIDHIDGCESDILARLQHHASPETREVLGRQWAAFVAARIADAACRARKSEFAMRPRSIR
ncbi:MAG: hemerythrin domain-containing protein [Micromonosporaceae bacterium]